MIDIEAVKKVAHLARLHLDEENLPEFARQFADIIKHFEEVAKIDTTGVQPLVTPTAIEVHERPDEVQIFTGRVDSILRNAPEKSGNLFKVPPVV